MRELSTRKWKNLEKDGPTHGVLALAGSFANVANDFNNNDFLPEGDQETGPLIGCSATSGSRIKNRFRIFVAPILLLSVTSGMVLLSFLQYYHQVSITTSAAAMITTASLPTLANTTGSWRGLEHPVNGDRYPEGQKTDEHKHDQDATHTTVGQVTMRLDTVNTRNNSINYSTIHNITQTILTQRRIAFLHVGKAGGNTVKNALPRMLCRGLQGIPEKHQACLNLTSRPESPLVQATDIELHIRNLLLKKQPRLLDDYTSFLWAARNPLTRVVSAYHYLHYNNTNSPYAQKLHMYKLFFYKHCFPTLQDLMRDIEQAFATIMTAPLPGTTTTTESPPSSILTTCQKLAIVALQGEERFVKDVNIHFYCNYRYYADLSIHHDAQSQHQNQQLPSVSYSAKEVFVVRTEHLWDDLKDLDRQLGGPASFGREGEVRNRNGILPKREQQQEKTSHQGDASDGGFGNISPQQRHYLCCILSNELQIYQEIILRALNLNHAQKIDTLHQVMEMCNVNVDQPELHQREEQNSNSKWSLMDYWPAWHQRYCPNLGRLDLSEIV